MRGNVGLELQWGLSYKEWHTPVYNNTLKQYPYMSQRAFRSARSPSTQSSIFMVSFYRFYSIFFLRGEYFITCTSTWSGPGGLRQV